MPNFNKVLLVGHLTKNPDVRNVNQGDTPLTIANSAIAVNDKYKDKPDSTMFIDVTVFGKLAETFGLYAKKGSSILIEGKLVFQQWEQNGEKRYKHEIIVSSFQLLDKKSSDSNQTNMNNEEEKDVPF